MEPRGERHEATQQQGAQARRSTRLDPGMADSVLRQGVIPQAPVSPAPALAFPAAFGTNVKPAAMPPRTSLTGNAPAASGDGMLSRRLQARKYSSVI